MRTGTVLFGLVLFRCWNALVVRTYFNPDEYWQSLEVAHHLVFGYGYTTWEWGSNAQIRGFSHPIIFAVFYKILQLSGLDSRWAVAYGPRILQGVFAGIGDFAVFRLAQIYFSTKAARWALFLQLISWFNFYCMVRTFSNSIETVFTTIALLYWPWDSLENVANKRAKDEIMSSAWKRNRIKSLIIAGIAIMIRPTNAVLWIFLGSGHLVQLRCLKQSVVKFVLKEVLPIGVTLIVVMVGIDFIGYGTITFVPWNFLRFNVLEGKGKLYGIHSWHWYFTQGFPAICATALPFSIIGAYYAAPSRKILSYLILWGNFVYSFSGHKEFRFVLPLLPIAIIYGGFGMVKMSAFIPKGLFRIMLGLIVVANCIAAAYLSCYHQAAPINVMDYLAKRIENRIDLNGIAIDFLTPCHATPYYSHLHANISLWFPDCSPLNRESDTGCESHQLQRNPASFLESRYKSELHRMPTYIVMFSSLLGTEVDGFLKENAFELDASFSHSYISGDADDNTVRSKMHVFIRKERNN